MLVLTRYPGQEIVIADNIFIKVIKVIPQGKKFSAVLAIDAHPNIVVDRLEVHNKKLIEKGLQPIRIENMPKIIDDPLDDFVRTEKNGKISYVRKK